MSRYEEFEQALTAELQQRTGAGASLGATLVASLIELLITTLPTCFQGKSASAIATRAVSPTPLDHRLMTVAVRNKFYEGSLRKFRQDQGDQLVDATFAACAKVGQAGMESLVGEVQPDAGGWLA